MDAMVSARVPVEIKKRGDRMLREIGATPTELVNSAYRFLLETGNLPKADAPVAIGAGQAKVLSGKEAESFRTRWSQRAVLAGDGGAGDFKEKLDRAREEYYARLA